MVTRKNQKALTAQEWSDFVDAINQTHGVIASAPAYRVFVKVHEPDRHAGDVVGRSYDGADDERPKFLVVASSVRLAYGVAPSESPRGRDDSLLGRS